MLSSTNACAAAVTATATASTQYTTRTVLHQNQQKRPELIPFTIELAVRCFTYPVYIHTYIQFTKMNGCKLRKEFFGCMQEANTVCE